MKRSLSFLLIISLLFSSWVGSGRVAAASGQNQKNKDKDVIGTTIKDLSGADRQLKMAVVKKEGVRLDFQSLAMDYSQVSDGHYYYIRRVGKNDFIIYQDAGKKIGSFHLKLDNYSEYWGGIVKYQSKFYVRISNLDNDTVKIAVVDLVNQETETICQIPGLDDGHSGGIVFYDNAIYSFYDYDIKNYRVEKRNMNGRIIKKYSFSNPAKKEYMDFINIMDGKLYYAVQKWKGRTREKVILRCLNMKNNRDKKVFCYTPDKKKLGAEVHLTMKGRELYCWEDYWWKNDDELAITAYYSSSKSGKMEKIGNGTIIDFAYTDRYYFYIDTKHRLHCQNRKTGKDQVISNIKMAEVSCTPKGLYVEKYDSWFAKGGMERANMDYSRALYFMSFDGKKVKMIEKRKSGHLEF